MFQNTGCAKQKHHGFEPLLQIGWMDFFWCFTMADAKKNNYVQFHPKFFHDKKCCPYIPGRISDGNFIAGPSCLSVTGTRVLSFIFMESKIRPEIGQNQTGLLNILSVKF